tara:strand:- start:386 stop:631 length:246 start_codon:yes stop_codon:yes gene_type:complete
MMATIRHEVARIFQSQRDRLRNADEPHMIRPKQDRKPLKGLARTLYLNRNAKLSKAEAFAQSGFVSKVKIQEKKESKDEKA